MLLNGRYVPMAVAASGAFRGGRCGASWRHSCSWTSWALSSREGGFDRKVLVGAGGLLYLGWNAGTAVGVMAGTAWPTPATLGLDAAFPALFLALLVPLLRHRSTPVVAALLGAAIALALTPITPAGVPVIAATAACAVGLLS